MITINEENFYTLKELSEQTNLSYKSVSVKLKRRNIPFDFIKDKKYYYHSSCLLYTSPSPRDRQKSRMPSSA